MANAECRMSKNDGNEGSLAHLVERRDLILSQNALVNAKPLHLSAKVIVLADSDTPGHV